MEAIVGNYSLRRSLLLLLVTCLETHWEPIGKLRELLGTHWEIKGIDGNAMGFSL